MSQLIRSHQPGPGISDYRSKLDDDGNLLSSDRDRRGPHGGGLLTAANFHEVSRIGP